MLMHKVYFETSCANMFKNFSLKMQLSGQLGFPLNLISLGLNLILEDTLHNTETL